MMQNAIEMWNCYFAQFKDAETDSFICMFKTQMGTDKLHLELKRLRSNLRDRTMTQKRVNAFALQPLDAKDVPRDEAGFREIVEQSNLLCLTIPETVQMV